MSTNPPWVIQATLDPCMTSFVPFGLFIGSVTRSSLRAMYWCGRSAHRCMECILLSWLYFFSVSAATAVPGMCSHNRLVLVLVLVMVMVTVAVVAPVIYHQQCQPPTRSVGAHCHICCWWATQVPERVSCSVLHRCSAVEVYLLRVLAHLVLG